MYARPASLDQALGWLSDGGARIMAGMTDILPAAGESPLQGRFVDVSGLSELRGILVSGDGYRIGGATTWSQIAARRSAAGVRCAEAALRARSVRRRSRTAARSPAISATPRPRPTESRRCWSSARPSNSPRDAACGGCRWTSSSQASARTALASDEILTAVVAPAPSPGLRSAFLKLGARRYLVISIAMVAAALDIADGVVREARIAVGACSAVATRLPRVEQRLLGRPALPSLGEAPQAEDFAALSPIDDLRASADYRREAAMTLVRRAIEACIAGEAGGAI